MPAVLPNMVAGTNDPEQILLIKIAYWLESAALAAGAADNGPMLPSMSPQFNDSRQVLLVKIAYWAEQLGSGGGGGGALGGSTSGAGAPPTDGSVGTLFYKDTATGNIFINTGTVASPTWDAL